MFLYKQQNKIMQIYCLLTAQDRRPVTDRSLVSDIMSVDVWARRVNSELVLYLFKMTRTCHNQDWHRRTTLDNKASGK